MRFLLATLLFIPLGGHSQQLQDSLWGGKGFRFGITLQTEAAIWSQNNLNSILAQNNLPTVLDFNSGACLGDILQWDRFRLTALAVIWRTKRSIDSQKLEQNFSGGELNAEYFVIRKRKFSVSPLIGGGILSGNTRIRKKSIGQNFSNALVDRNTTELFNKQGYINGAINFGFCYSPRLKDHLLQAAIGYRMGIGNTNWSTDRDTETLTDKITAPLRQVYITLKLNFLLGNRRIRG